MNKKIISEIFKRLSEANPEPKSELIYASDFELLIAVILSAQATDKQVNIVTQKLFPVANTPKKILELGEKGLKNLIRSIGLYNNKAKNIIACCKMLLDKFDGKVPDNSHDLQQLPGVGRKTANVVMNVAFGGEVIAVDTHIFRLGNRIGIAKGKNPLQVEQNLMKAVPKKYLKYAHHWLILHGRYICKAQTPQCMKCTINDLCEYPYKKLLNN